MKTLKEALRVSLRNANKEDTKKLFGNLKNGDTIYYTTSNSPEKPEELKILEIDNRPISIWMNTDKNMPGVTSYFPTKACINILTRGKKKHQTDTYPKEYSACWKKIEDVDAYNIFATSIPELNEIKEFIKDLTA